MAIVTATMARVTVSLSWRQSHEIAMKNVKRLGDFERSARRINEEVPIGLPPEKQGHWDAEKDSEFLDAQLVLRRRRSLDT